MIFTTSHDNGISVVRPGVERLTAVNAATFKAFLDSSGLGALVGILKKIGHRGDISVCGLNDDLEHMFRLSRMDQVFTSHRDAVTAVKSMGENL